MKLNLPQRLSKVLKTGVRTLNMLQYITGKLANGGFKLMQSAAVMSILLVPVQATITLELNDH